VELSNEYADDSGSHRGRLSGKGRDGHCNGRSSTAGGVLNGVCEVARVTSTFYGERSAGSTKSSTRRSESYIVRDEGDRVASLSESSIDSVLRRQTSGLHTSALVDDDER